MAKFQPKSKPVVPVSTFYDMNEQLVTTDAEIAKAYKDMADNYPDDIDDKQVVAILRTIPGDGKSEDVQLARIAALENAQPKVIDDTDPVPVTTDPNTGKPTAPLSAVPKERQPGQRYGAMVDAAFVAHLDKAAEAKEDLDGAPLLVSKDLERLFIKRDKDGKVTENMMKSWPIMGSGTKKWKENNTGANGPFDHYEITLADGSKIKGTFRGDFYDQTPKGKEYAFIIGHLKAMVGNEYAPLATTPNTEFFTRLRGDKRRVEAEMARWTSRRSNSIGRFARAVNYVVNKLAIEELLPNINVGLINDDLDVAAKMPKPIVLVMSKPGQAIPVMSAPMALTNFNRLKPVEAAQTKEKDIASLLGTIKRKPKAGNGTGDATGATGASKEGLDIKVSNTKEFEGITSALVTAFESDSFMTSLHSLMSKVNNVDRKQVLSNLFDLQPDINAICTKYRSEYDAMIENDRAAREAEAKAKLGKAA